MTYRNDVRLLPRPVVRYRARSPRRRPVARDLAVQAVLWAYAAIAFGPLVLVLLSSLRPNPDLVKDPLGLPRGFDVSNYVRAWTDASFGVYVKNSVIVTVASVLLAVTAAVLVSYPLGRWAFRGKGVLTAFFLSGLMLPIKLGVVPIYYLLEQVGLSNSLLGLVLIYAASNIPVSVFILAAFFRQLPGDLEEAATIDGATDFRLFWSVMLPLVRPALATVVVFTLAPVWNDFFYPLVLLRDTAKYTMPVGLSFFFGVHSVDRGALFAGIVIAAAPLAALFAVFTKQIVAGLTAGLGK